MRAPVSWIREYVDLPGDLPVEELAAELTALGLKLESLERPGQDITGPLVIGRVLTMEPEPQKNGKTINWCTVDVGPELNAAHGTGEAGDGVGIVCGAHNFAPGDLVVVVLPGAVLPGNFEIAARKTYGHVSAGMICSSRELGLGDDHEGIIVLPADAGKPGDDVFELLHLRDEVIEFEINPDRAYALSLRGVAREAALAFGAPYTDPAARAVPAPNGEGYPVVVDDPAGCPVFVTRTVTGFDPAAPTPSWLARRLFLAGMRPISLAVDVTNYVMLELGQPIHGYDGDKLAGAIRVRRATPGERLRTLDGVDRTLSPEDLLITDGSGPIGLAGVMGGETTELGPTTSHVVIEAAHFDPVSIFRTQKRHKLPSEASKRFERGVDPELPAHAADRVAELLTTYGGGRIEPGVTQVGAAPPRQPIRIAPDLPARVTGMAIDEDTTTANLLAVGCSVVADSEGSARRRRRGVPTSPTPSTSSRRSPGSSATSRCRRSCRPRPRVAVSPASSGCAGGSGGPSPAPAAWRCSASRSSATPRSTRSACPRTTCCGTPSGWRNPLSNEEPGYTTTLLPGLLKAAARNVGRGAAGVALFETGTVAFPVDRGPAPIFGVEWRPSDDELAKLFAALPEQPLHLAVVLAGERERPGWWGDGRAAGWADAIGLVRLLAAELGADVRVESGSRMPWHPGRCAVVHVGDSELGHAGELHPKVCQAFGLPPRTAAVEIDLDLLMRHAVDVTPGPEFSTYPVAKEDVALLVDAAVTAAEVEDALREGAGDLLESIRLFDVFTGEQVGAGKKSLAFALRFRAPDRTLTEQETGAARDAAVALAAQRVGAVQR